jgi:hypothetical protein
MKLKNKSTKNNKKNLKSIGLTRDQGHKIEITPQKASKKNMKLNYQLTQYLRIRLKKMIKKSI